MVRKRSEWLVVTGRWFCGFTLCQRTLSISASTLESMSCGYKFSPTLMLFTNSSRAVVPGLVFGELSAIPTAGAASREMRCIWSRSAQVTARNQSTPTTQCKCSDVKVAGGARGCLQHSVTHLLSHSASHSVTQVSQSVSQCESVCMVCSGVCDGVMVCDAWCVVTLVWKPSLLQNSIESCVCVWCFYSPFFVFFVRSTFQNKKRERGTDRIFSTAVEATIAQGTPTEQTKWRTTVDSTESTMMT